jgi:peptidoglycan/LPS O-acetylase OafA/YrhL
MSDATSTGQRYGGLDGLRGLAALVVLVHHVLLSVPVLADAYRSHPTGASTPTKLLTYSPLHLVWAGTEAVLVFFVLSGFVLTHAMVGDRRPSWVDYYPRRVVRLYLPVLAALVVAFPQARWLRTDATDDQASWVYNAHIGSGTVRNLVEDATLWHEKASFIDGPLWSLHWEVVFSLALPVYLLLTRARSRALAVTALCALVAVTAVGVHERSDAAVFLPVFGLGVLAAAHRSDLGRLARRCSPGLLLAGCLLLTARWTATGVRDLGLTGTALATAATVVGALLVVLAFLDGAVGRWAAGSSVVRWLGRRSFSLYLTHAPLITTVAFLLGGHPPVWLLLLLCVPLALAVAECFGRWVEEPAHRASQRVGRWARGHLAQR